MTPQDIIEHRLEELDLSRLQLVKILGYKNRNKGIRRLNSILAGDYRCLEMMHDRLTFALNLPPQALRDAALKERTRLYREAEDQRRVSFKPHAIISTERSVPSPIFIAATIGIDRLLKIEFGEERARGNFVSLALKELSARLGQWGGSALPGFGRPTGFVINYAYDRQARFDLEGCQVEHKGGHSRLPEAWVGLTKSNKDLRLSTS